MVAMGNKGIFEKKRPLVLYFLSEPDLGFLPDICGVNHFLYKVQSFNITKNIDA